MAVNPLTSFTAQAHPLGGEILLKWETASDLPDSYKFYVFKRRDAVPTPEEIIAYMNWLIANVPNTPFNYQGLFVFTDIENFERELSDFGGRAENERLKNSKHYYYAALIYDIIAKEYSATLSANAVPDKSVKIKILDGKELVAQAISRVLDGIKGDDGVKLDLRKHIDVLKHLPIEPEKLDFIRVQRISGETRYQFLNNLISQYKTSVIKGDVDADVIEVTIYCIENPDRRDSLLNIFRAYKRVIQRYCMRSGALEALVSIGGDGLDPSMDNARLATASFTVTLLLENKTLINYDEFLSMDIEMKYEVEA